jgi:cytoskeleton protein RodZ
LRLEFTDTSWTEVYDATDRRLMFGLGESGRVRDLSGVAPLRVTLGAASAVTAYVNDGLIVIPRREGRDASKFVIEADGAVRAGGQ